MNLIFILIYIRMGRQLGTDFITVFFLFAASVPLGGSEKAASARHGPYDTTS